MKADDDVTVGLTSSMSICQLNRPFPQRFTFTATGDLEASEIRGNRSRLIYLLPAACTSARSRHHAQYRCSGLRWKEGGVYSMLNSGRSSRHRTRPRLRHFHRPLPSATAGTRIPQACEEQTLVHLATIPIANELERPRPASSATAQGVSLRMCRSFVRGLYRLETSWRSRTSSCSAPTSSGALVSSLKSVSCRLRTPQAGLASLAPPSPYANEPKLWFMAPCPDEQPFGLLFSTVAYPAPRTLFCLLARVAGLHGRMIALPCSTVRFLFRPVRRLSGIELALHQT